MLTIFARFRRVGIVARPTSDGQAQVAEVPCYGVASVYTPPEKRKKGYAAHMMRLLHWVLAPEGSIPAEFPAEWGTPPVARLQDGIFSVLYSDIGDQFYRLNCSPLPKQDLGWMTTGQINTTWPAAKMPLDSAQWVFLSKEEADKVWEEDAQLMKKDALAVAHTGGVACSFLPDRGNGRLSYERHRKLKNGLTLEVVGIQLARNSPEDPLVFATWAAESSESLTLVLTRLRATKEMFGGLLAQIMAFAERHGVDMIETWNLPENLSAVAKELGGHTFKRNNHLSAIKWYGPEAQNEVKWMFNEKSVEYYGFETRHCVLTC